MSSSTRLLILGVSLFALIGGVAPSVRAQGPSTNLRDRVSALEAQVAALQTALANESAARESADGVLQENIDAEAVARDQADAVLQEGIQVAQ